MQLQLPSRTLDLTGPLIMGVLNVTPDSFSDGGRFVSPGAALDHGLRMIEEGARIIDVGGESTRPGAQPVSAQEEMDRVVPVIERLRARSACVISVDTMKPQVMDAACAAGAEMINDVSALQAGGAFDVARRHRAAVVLMHMQGEPRTMQQDPRYGNVVEDVLGFLRQRVSACEAAGIDRARLVIDPGFGFGKTLDHNLRLLANLDRFEALGLPVLVGMSRKSMLGQLLDRPVEERAAAGLAAAVVAVWQGARIVRTHDVHATMDAIRLAAEVRGRRDEHDGNT